MGRRKKKYQFKYVGEIWAMNKYKKIVLGYYPSANIQLRDFIVWDYRYGVYIDKPDVTIETVIGVGITENKAWRHAADYLNDLMLWKLEQ